MRYDYCDAYQEHLDTEATWNDYYREAYASEIADARRESEYAQEESDRWSAVWHVVAFGACFGAGDRFLAVDAIVETLAALCAHFRQVERDADDCPF